MCGIGGRIIVEVKFCFSYWEFFSWCKFWDKWGSFYVGMRVECGLVLFVVFYVNLYSKEMYKLYDFMLYEEEFVISLD